ncbi:MAG: UbiD family decarboxylase, partial [Chloroflexota bacterium]|nr:UbiD family decarboxylase [Chloroflexota bacterium]
MRAFLLDLDAAGELQHVTAPTSPHLEVARVIAAHDGQPLLFEDLPGYPGWRMAAGYVARREHFARALGCAVPDLPRRMAESLERPQAPPVVNSAPCQEVVEPEVDLTRLPIPRYHPLDGGPYVTAGVAVIHDPDLGRNLSFHRLLLRDAQHFTA